MAWRWSKRSWHVMLDADTKSEQAACEPCRVRRHSTATARTDMFAVSPAQFPRARSPSVSPTHFFCVVLEPPCTTEATLTIGLFHMSSGWFNPTEPLRTMHYRGNTDYRIILHEFRVVQPHRTLLNHEQQRMNSGWCEL